MRKTYYVVVAAILAIMPTRSAIAEDGSLPPAAQALPLSTGSLAADVKNIFGPPDKTATSQQGNGETWYYGRSLVFVVDGHVTGWSDFGELSQRKDVHRFQKSEMKDRKDFKEEGWVNAYTPPEKDQGSVEAEILDSITESESGTRK